jgi:hypothetical protein
MPVKKNPCGAKKRTTKKNPTCANSGQVLLSEILDPQQVDGTVRVAKSKMASFGAALTDHVTVAFHNVTIRRNWKSLRKGEVFEWVQVDVVYGRIYCFAKGATKPTKSVTYSIA